MVTENTVRVSMRLKTDVHSAVLAAASAQGVDPATFMQSAIEEAVLDLLPSERQEQIRSMNQLFAYSQKLAKKLFEQGKFDEHFTLTVIRSLMKDAEARKLYEKAIAADAYEDAAPGKTPVNMYLGWYIKNAVPAKPLTDSDGKPKRAFVKGEPIKSYTLLALA